MSGTTVERTIEAILTDAKRLTEQVRDQTAPRLAERKTTRAMAAWHYLREWIATGFPAGGGGGRSTDVADPTSRAAFSWPSDEDARLNRKVPIKANANADYERDFAALDDALTAAAHQLAKAVRLVSIYTPSAELEVESFACQNPKCDHVCTGRTSSDRVRRWHGKTDPICSRCYQWMDAQHKAGIGEDACRLWPYDSRSDKQRKLSA